MPLIKTNTIKDGLNGHITEAAAISPLSNTHRSSSFSPMVEVYHSVPEPTNHHGLVVSGAEITSFGRNASVTPFGTNTRSGMDSKKPKDNRVLGLNHFCGSSQKPPTIEGC
ncbi:hypothetical protein DSL72_005289 [Monilinia vaccinii-corymbosi]|uniref:Uncharacterized protein n=1 Tax=Monilinia vaccinii-corymbosi TaxID=61207 RepID=A0A8A3PEY8_9HELO|nr:hypothetical protein DSL72_005289 [Monilinia vaccinii-corymbosi]